MPEPSPLNIADLQAFLDGEIYAHAAKVYQTFSLEPDERVENHACIKDCTIREVSFNQWGKATLTVRYFVNHSGFREGDTVLLNRPGVRGESILADGFEVDWLDHDPVTRTVRLAQSFNNDGPLPFNLGDQVVIDQSLAGHLQAVHRSLAEIDGTPAEKRFVENFLNGRLEFSPVQVQRETFDAIAGALQLTGSQREGFELAVSTFPAAGIQGPPGTGKTFVLAAIAAYYLSQGKNVLVSALSHFAINNALNQAAAVIAALGLPGRAIKVSRNKNEGLLQEPDIPLRIIHGLKGTLPPGANVYGLTSFKAVYDLRGMKLDVLILDEASQLPLPHAFMMMRFARKTILVGDHRQMRPLIAYRHHPHPSLYHSVFEFFRDRHPGRVVMLRDTFRMNDPIAAFPSRVFYGGRLVPYGETGGRRLTVRPAEGEDRRRFREIMDPARPSVFVELNHRFATKNCPEEADLVADLVLAAVLEYDVPARSIAVLVPFRAQQELIRSRLRKRGQEHGKRLELVLVDTVERMQGQERDLVIYSLAASDPDRLSAMAEFFFEPHRFNVAITRAKTKRIVVGSRHLLSARPDDVDTLRHLNLFCRFFRSEFTVRV